MPSLRESFNGGSLAALLAALEAETLRNKALPLPPDQEEDLYNDEIDEEDYDIDPSSTDNFTLEVPAANQPTIMAKRVHALRELLSSERAYASDLALVRDIHIPLALGQRTPFSSNSTSSLPLPFSPSSGLSSSSGTIVSNSSQLSPPMTRDDVRIIFGNIDDLAMISDNFIDRLEDALGSALDGGYGGDRVGALFLEIIPALEPPYKTYINRHPTALAHLNSLPSSPALSAYLSHTGTLASSLTHAWDLPSLLIKPVQQLLKYSLLLGAIIDATPDSHGDRPALVRARKRMEEVTRSVNEDRRRREVVRAVLGGAPTNGHKSKKSNGTTYVSVGTAASAHLSRMKTLRTPKIKDLENPSDNAEAVEVARLEGELQRYMVFWDKLAGEVKSWRLNMRQVLVALWQWGITFGCVLGLTPSPSVLDISKLVGDEPDSEGRSEAYDAFTMLLATLPGLCTDLEHELQKVLFPLLSNLKTMLGPPTKLLNAMHSLEPLHIAPVHTSYGSTKSRQPAPALLAPSQSYLALRSALLSELPILLRAVDKATSLAVRTIAEKQAAFYASVGELWVELWNALMVEGERRGGSEETLRVWLERWDEAGERLSVMTRRSTALPSEVLSTPSPLGFNANTSPPPDLTTFITYRNDRYIAAGGFSDVYKCWYNDGVPKEVAVKAFRFSFALDGDPDNKSRKMARRELGIWRRLCHVNVVPFLGVAYGFGMHGVISLVSLWMPNGSLHHFLEKCNHNLGVGHRLQLMLDIANGLDYLHSFPIIHGDLNCNNVLLDEDYTARLVDFGFASLVGNIPEALSYLQRSTKRSGALRWSAPEQLESESCIRTTKHDIYSFGCITLQGSLSDSNTTLVLISPQALSGKQPWSEVREDAAVILRLARGDKPVRPECETLYDSHWDLIQQCWSPVGDRPHANEIVSFVKQFLNDSQQSEPLRDWVLSWASETETRLDAVVSTTAWARFRGLAASRRAGSKPI